MDFFYSKQPWQNHHVLQGHVASHMLPKVPPLWFELKHPGQRNSGWKVSKCHLLKTATPWTSRPAASLAIFHGARTASILSKQISAKNCFLRSPKQLIVPEVPCPLTRLEVWDCQWILRKQDPVWAPCLSDSNALDKSKTILTKKKNCVIVNHVNTKCSFPVSA